MDSRTTDQVSEECDMACAILQKTNDGDDLAPQHLWLLQEWVNGNLNEKGKKAFKEVHDQVIAGKYKKPWLCGVEHLTQDHEGYVYWKGKHVEHYSHDNYEEKKRAAEELAGRCRILESKGIPVTCNAAIWRWDKDKPDGGY